MIETFVLALLVFSSGSVNTDFTPFSMLSGGATNFNAKEPELSVFDLTRATHVEIYP
jgi:hypothetical protein